LRSLPSQAPTSRRRRLQAAATAAKPAFAGCDQPTQVGFATVAAVSNCRRISWQAAFPLHRLHRL